MKKVLVTGAAGCLGTEVIKNLLAEGKYEITALDLKNRKVFKKLKRYRRRINVIYGDILDRTLIEALIKEHDVVIHLATCLPPLSEFKKDLANIIEYNGIENIVRAINYYNPNCFLIYGSTTSLYGENDSTVESALTRGEHNYYNIAKKNAENLVTKKLKHYTILRVPIVLGDLRYDHFIYNVKRKNIVETITKEDAAYAFVKCISLFASVNKKIFNIGGGATCRCSFNYLVANIIKYYGLSINYFNTSIFVDKDFCSPILLDSDKSNKLLNYRNDSLESYFMRLKRKSKKGNIPKFLGKLYSIFLKKVEK